MRLLGREFSPTFISILMKRLMSVLFSSIGSKTIAIKRSGYGMLCCADSLCMDSYIELNEEEQWLTKKTRGCWAEGDVLGEGG
mmetsp:Transcript_8312/g.9778  ORF Transcript_8312/g.9778 Transcript_8312/m.9778 type:complete len:83 (+) Transcript_8312:458-706(+)